MATEWMPEAVRDSHNWRYGTMVKNTGALRVVAHSTENAVGTNPASIASYMANNGAKLTGGYTLLVPLNQNHAPLQLRPANVAAGSLRNNGSLARSPNKEGTRLIAISLICFAKDNHATRDLGPWWPQVLAWVRSLGVPDHIVGNKYPPGNGGLDKIPTSTWYGSESGWCFHATAPNPPSAHWDPGRVDPLVLFQTSAPTPEPPKPQPPDPTMCSFAVEGGTVTVRILKRTNPMMQGRDIRQCQALLSEWALNPGPHDGYYGDGTANAVRQFQTSRGLTADSICGSRTWQSLLGG